MVGDELNRYDMSHLHTAKDRWRPLEICFAFRSEAPQTRSIVVVGYLAWCHGSTGSPLALMRRVLRGGMTVLEGGRVLARGTGSCT